LKPSYFFKVVVSICTEFIQNEDSLRLLRNRLPEGEDERVAPERLQSEEELELSQKELFQSLLDEIPGLLYLKGESSAYIQSLKLSHSMNPAWIQELKSLESQMS
jgi:hypothetical protein